MAEAPDAIEMLSTPLASRHEALGAVFAPAFGWKMPARYQDVAEERQAIRTAAGLIDMSSGGAIKIGGTEGPQFLNGLVTNDVKSLEKGKGIAAALLNGHGKVKAFCRILGMADEFLVLTEPQTHQKVLAYIIPFTMAGDFKAEDVSDQYRLLSVQGQASARVLKEVCFQPLPDLAEHQWIDTLIGGHTARVVAADHTGETGFDILAPIAGLADVWDFLLLKGGFHSMVAVGLEALESLRIEAGIPVYGIDADENNMMLETGLSEYVSFNKGCYTGQEAVAMATYRGHVSKRLSGLRVEGPVQPRHGDRIFSPETGKDIGYITSSALSDHFGVIALGYVKYGFFDPGGRIEIDTSGERLTAEIVPLPFYRRSEMTEQPATSA